MFRAPEHRSKLSYVFSMAEVTYHSVVRTLRSSHRNAVIGIVLNIVQSLVMILVFVGMFLLLGVKTAPIRGDYLIYVMSGIFMYLTHIKTVSAIAGAGNPLSGMMQHAPMNTVISIVAAAISTLYQQVFTVIVILTVYHITISPVSLQYPVMALGMMLLSWFFGIGVGMVFLALNPWIPDLAGVLRMLYIRVNMIASGKLFVVNTLPATTVALFDWNPLFHIIDQNRGAVFLHYTPLVTSVSYPIYVSLALIMLGLMGEFYTRQYISVSWSAGR